MSPHFPLPSLLPSGNRETPAGSPRDASRGIFRRMRLPGASRQPSRLTLGVAAGTVVAAAVTAITMASVSGGASPAGKAGSLDAISHTAGATTAGQTAQAQTHPVSSLPHNAPAARPASAPAPAPAPAPPPPQPWNFYDTVSPGAIPGNAGAVAVYATGKYAASPQVTAGRWALWIDTTGTDYAASALDVEPGNVTPDEAGAWAYNRLQRHPSENAILYTFQNEWPAVRASVAGLPSWMQSHIRWWIADPTGTPHIVPGSQATQWYWGQNYDISTALPGFH